MTTPRKTTKPKAVAVPREPRTADAAEDSIAAHQGNDSPALAAPPPPSPVVHDATTAPDTAGGNVAEPHKEATYDEIPCMGGGPLDGQTATVRTGARYYEAPSGDGRWRKAIYERIPKGDGSFVMIYRGMV